MARRTDIDDAADPNPDKDRQHPRAEQTGGPIEGLATKLVEHFRDPDTNPDPARRSTAPPRPIASGASRPRTESERESEDRSEGDDESPGDPSGPDSPGPGPGGPGGGKRGRRRRRKPPPPPPFPR